MVYGEVLIEGWRMWSRLAAWETKRAAAPSGKLMTDVHQLHNEDLQHSSLALSGRGDLLQ